MELTTLKIRNFREAARGLCAGPGGGVGAPLKQNIFFIRADEPFFDGQTDQRRVVRQRNIWNAGSFECLPGGIEAIVEDRYQANDGKTFLPQDLDDLQTARA